MEEFTAGALRTVALAATSWVIGLPIGMALAFAALLHPGSKLILRGVAVFLTVVPFLAILFWLHYPLQTILEVVWPPNLTCAALLSAYVACAFGDVLADEMTRLERRLFEAALVLGVPAKQLIWKVIFPAALEASMPRVLGLAVVSIHMTMFASLIGVEELFRVTQRLNAQILKPVELFTVMAFIYAALCVPLHFLAASFAKRLRHHGGDT